MKRAHVVVPDLFLPPEVARHVCADMRLPALEKILARSKARPLPLRSLEEWLCSAFGVPGTAVAPVTLLADGLNAETAYWLRADPVHLRLNRDQMILQTNVTPSLEEAQQLCAYLNGHFAEPGMRFIAPHPQRWYLRLDDDPGLLTHSVYQVEGRNSRSYMPHGANAVQWHGVLNEVQMALYGHPLYRIQESRGALPINSIWLWGGGHAVTPTCSFAQLSGDSALAQAFALAANIPCLRAGDEQVEGGCALHVWDGLGTALRRGDFHAWRVSLSRFEQECLRPLLGGLESGEIERIILDVPQEENASRHELTRGMLWKAWLRSRPLENYPLGNL